MWTRRSGEDSSNWTSHLWNPQCWLCKYKLYNWYWYWSVCLVSLCYEITQSSSILNLIEPYKNFQLFKKFKFRSRLKHREKSQWSGFETCLMLLMMILILTDKNMKYSEINCFEIYTPVQSDTIRVCWKNYKYNYY